MAVEIPLRAGLITQADPEEVGENGSIVLKNADFTTLGSIKKRSGRGNAYNTGKVFVAIKRWYNPNIVNNYYWIGITNTGSVWYSVNLVNWEQLEGALDIGDPTGKKYDARIYD